MLPTHRFVMGRSYSSAVALDEAGRDLRDGDHRSLRASHQLGEDFEDLRFDEKPAVCDEIELRFQCHGAQFGSELVVGDDAHERKQYLIEPRLDLRIDQGLVQLDLVPPMKPIEQELVAELARFVFEAVRAG